MSICENLRNLRNLRELFCVRRGGRAAALLREIRFNPCSRVVGSGVFRVFREIRGPLSPTNLLNPSTNLRHP